MTDDVARFLVALGSTFLWSIVSIAIVMMVFEFLNWRYHLMKEVFQENSVAAAIFAGSFVLGIFFVVAQIVTS